MCYNLGEVIEMNYILVLISTMLLACNFAVSKRYQLNEGACMETGLRFNMFLGLTTGVIFFALSGFRVEFSWFSLLMALGMSSCAAAYTILGFSVMKAGNMAVYTLFLMSGGMILPYIYGVAFLDESLTVLRILGLLFILGAVVLTNKSDRPVPKKILLLCVAIFVFNGFVSIFSKAHQISQRYAAVNSIDFVLYTGIVKFVLSFVILLFCKKERQVWSFSKKSSLLLAVGSAALSGVSYSFQLIGAKELPATVLYPMITGGAVIFSAVSGRVFFKEKPTKAQLISIILCFIGTLLFL